MKYISWSEEKNDLLKVTRDISFEEIQKVIEKEGIVGIIKNPQEKYSHQQIFLISINGYIWHVPFVETEEMIFLKTAFPSRLSTKKYINS